MIFTKQNRDKAIEQLDFWFSKDLKVKIDAVRPIRSLPQNRYLHGVVFSVLAIELGLTIDEVKQLLKQKFLSYEKNKTKFVKETSKLSTTELEAFMESCRTYSQLEFNCYIPKPNEVTDEMLEEIMKYEKYLGK
ncbi:hypothetical protein M0P65_07505 [Candidatus Gracilibacteria bacterium]|nr:hypothetical protein [Candidatus Gracilibacteria bacterium]